MARSCYLPGGQENPPRPVQEDAGSVVPRIHRGERVSSAPDCEKPLSRLCTVAVDPGTTTKRGKQVQQSRALILLQRELSVSHETRNFKKTGGWKG